MSEIVENVLEMRTKYLIKIFSDSEFSFENQIIWSIYQIPTNIRPSLQQQNSY